MSSTVKTRSVFSLLVILPLLVLADKSPIKLGNISEEELRMTYYPSDSTADAVILCDYGTTKIQINRSEGGFQVVYDKICRIKIFNNNGYDWATGSIRLYNDATVKEDISSLKGYTYNMDNGKIQKEKLSKQSIFEEKTSDEWTTIKFTMPEVKEGSVIEYQYQIVSDRLTSLRTWEFQKAIPVKWSEYLVEIPEYFNYLKISTGYEPFAVNEIKEEIRSETFVEFTKTYSRYGIQGPQTSTSKLDYKATCYHWAIENAPGLKDESFVGNVYDYLTKVEFQLSNYKFPGYQFENVLGSWEDINDQLLTHNEDFKSNISGKRFYQDELNLILSQCETGEEKMRGIYRYVTTRMQWDGVCDFIPNQPVKKTYDGRTGSAADINALLISMLRAAGLNCEPVLLSTRDNGQVHPIYPIMHKYNYLIAMVIIDGKSYLLDATEKNIPPGMLPVRCLNQRGRCISKTKGNWINLQPSIGSQETFICNLKLDNEVLTGNMQTSLKGYTGISCNKKYTMDGEEKYLEGLLEKHKDWEVENYNVTNENPCHDGFKEKFNVVIKNAVYEGGNRLYIDPVLVNRWDENPLKNESRKFPVDFNYPILSKYISNIIVPEGYEIEEIPESIQFSLPDKSATFIYLVKKLGNTIQLMNQFEIKKSIYSVEEYKPLREFWSLVVSKNKEQIVLKKIETHEF